MHKILAAIIAYIIIGIMLLIPTGLFSISAFAFYKTISLIIDENGLPDYGIKVNGTITEYKTVPSPKNRSSSQFSFTFKYQDQSYNKTYYIPNGFRTLPNINLNPGDNVPFYIDPDNPNHYVPAFIYPHTISNTGIELFVLLTGISFSIFLFVFLVKRIKFKNKKEMDKVFNT